MKLEAKTPQKSRFKPKIWFILNLQILIYNFVIKLEKWWVDAFSRTFLIRPLPVPTYTHNNCVRKKSVPFLCVRALSEFVAFQKIEDIKPKNYRLWWRRKTKTAKILILIFSHKCSKYSNKSISEICSFLLLKKFIFGVLYRGHFKRFLVFKWKLNIKIVKQIKTRYNWWFRIAWKSKQ